MERPRQGGRRTASVGLLFCGQLEASASSAGGGGHWSREPRVARAASSQLLDSAHAQRLALCSLFLRQSGSVACPCSRARAAQRRAGARRISGKRQTPRERAVLTNPNKNLQAAQKRFIRALATIAERDFEHPPKFVYLMDDDAFL